MKLYAVTAINSNKLSRDRCVAICETLQRAKDIVENNECDIWELEYDLVVIESKETDSVYSFGRKNEQYWYEWRGPLGWDGVHAKGYVSIERPERYKHTVGFGIG